MNKQLQYTIEQMVLRGYVVSSIATALNISRQEVLKIYNQIDYRKRRALLLKDWDEVRSPIAKVIKEEKRRREYRKTVKGKNKPTFYRATGCSGFWWEEKDAKV